MVAPTSSPQINEEPKTCEAIFKWEHEGRGRRIGLEGRREHAQDIEAACKADARLHEACEIVGITSRTLQRWRAHQDLESGDGRPDAVRPVPTHALTGAERAQVLSVANEPRFADMPPERIGKRPGMLAFTHNFLA